MIGWFVVWGSVLIFSTQKLWLATMVWATIIYVLYVRISLSLSLSLSLIDRLLERIG